jgi:hypothetical protein
LLFRFSGGLHLENRTFFKTGTKSEDETFSWGIFSRLKITTLDFVSTFWGSEF